MTYLSNKKIAQLLCEIRSARHYSQSYIARGICSQSSLSKYENGERTPSFQNIILILEKLNISVQEFEYLLFKSSSKYKATKLLNSFIKNFDIPSLRNNTMLKQYCQSYPYIINWLNYCFSIKIKQDTHLAFSYMSTLINQDEFYFNDFELLIYGLHTLPHNNIVYTTKRIYEQMIEKEMALFKPWLFADLFITAGSIAYYDKNINKAISHWQTALTHAKQMRDMQRIRYIIILLNKPKPSNEAVA